MVCAPGIQAGAAEVLLPLRLEWGLNQAAMTTKRSDELSYMLLLDRCRQLEVLLPLRLEWGSAMVRVSLCKATKKPT